MRIIPILGCLAALSLQPADSYSLDQVTSIPQADSTLQSSTQVNRVAVVDKVSRLLGRVNWTDWDSMKSKLDVEVIDSSQYASHNPIAVPTGNTIYRIDLKVPVRSRRESSFRRFSVYVDSLSGLLLEIESAEQSYYEKLATGELRERSATAIPGIKDPYATWKPGESLLKDSEANFAKAIDAIPGSALGTDRIRARFLVMDHFSYGKQPVWVIEVWGGMPFVMSGRAELKPYESNYSTTIVDTAGKMIVREGGGWDD